METTDNLSPAPVIEARGLAKHYGQTKALDGVDLRIHQGSFTAVMGASGSGKSTLLHLLAGLAAPTAGTVLIEGVDPRTLSDAKLTRLRRRKIGLVFQDFNLIPQLTALENIMLPLLADGKGKRIAKERAYSLAETLGILPQLAQRPDTLSGGQRLMVTIARALSMDPAIILADEPTGNLDSAAGGQICEIFDRLCREENRTILIVTHDETVASWAERVITLKDGKIAEEKITRAARS
ncbi:MAG: ABC transporter ATP-binding protein [Thermoguttaceae bacterium]|nr:ABC transporter ATP-binding protein [Thermoguttaceae bacterium]